MPHFNKFILDHLDYIKSKKYYKTETTVESAIKMIEEGFFEHVDEKYIALASSLLSLYKGDSRSKEEEYLITLLLQQAKTFNRQFIIQKLKKYNPDEIFSTLINTLSVSNNKDLVL